MSDKKQVTAAVLVIGNEILSGRTLDKNTQHIAQKLGDKGILVREVRVVPDVSAEIGAALNAMRARYDYVFTTGGIGPTHDDITVDAVSEALGVDAVVHEGAYARLLAHYGAADFTEARQRMARGPKGAGLIDNPVSAAPGFVVGNVYIMAGVPHIMQAMLDNVLAGLVGGALMQSITLTCAMPESEIAGLLGEVQAQYGGVDIGSYPFFQMGNVGVSVVLRGTDMGALEEVAGVLEEALFARNIVIKQV